MDHECHPKSLLLRLLGPPTLVGRDGAVTPSLSGKPAALLAYLAVVGSVPRERLVTLLWGESGDSRARNAFRQTLHRLRAIAGPSLFADSRDSLSLATGSGLEVDVDAFRAAIGAEQWQAAAALYTGEFLQGLVTGEQAFDEWIDAERRRLEAAYIGVLDAAASAAAESGDWNTALEYTRLLTATDPLNVAGCEREVRILIGAGKREEAVLIAELHADVIAREVGEAAAAPLRQLASRSRVAAPAAQRPAGNDTRRPPPFIGRESELSRLLAVWGAAGREHGGLVLVTGPAGIGKTRLFAEFAARARSLGPIRLASGKERGEWDIPYAGIADALRMLVRAPAAAGASRHLLVEAARLLPELRDRFDLPDSEPLRDDAELLRFFEGVSAFIEAVADDEPLCIHVDDFQRASPRSTQLAAYLADRLAHTPVVFAYALRTDEPGEDLPAHVNGFMRAARQATLGDQPKSIELALRAMSDSDAVQLAGSIPTESAGERALVLEAARGNPGRMLALGRGDMPPAGRALVPLRDILRERLVAATRQEQRLFITAAFYGRVTPLRLIAAGAHLSEGAALEAALALEVAGLLVQDGLGVSPSHPDSLELAIEGTGPAGTALLAGWAADALAVEPDALPADLARLYIASGRGDEAAPHVRRAALQAAASGANDAAESLLTRNLALPLDDEARTELEGLLRALGGGPLRISGLVTPAGESTESPPSEMAEPSPEPTQRSGTQRRLYWVARYPYASVAGIALVFVSLALGYESMSPKRAAQGTFLTDTLLVTDASGGPAARTYPVLGSLIPAPRLGSARSASDSEDWFDSLTPPWVNPRRSPDQRRAIVERITSDGAHVYLLSRDGRETIPLATSPGEWLALGWSPDGSWALASRATSDRASGDATHLYAVETRHGGRTVPVDTSAGRLVSEAIWSPSGDQIAWIARDVRTRQQDVYVAGFGEAPVNVSRDAGENYGITWSPDGSTVAFTSERDGRPQIYSVELEPELRTRRLTNSPAADKNPAFSPDGRQLAFESTRGGQLGVWLTTVIGGAAQRITPPNSSFALGGWQRAGLARHIQRIDVSGPAIVSVGDTFALTAQIVDQRGDVFPSRDLTWTVSSGSAEAVAQAPANREASRVFFVARGTGNVRITASVGSWRYGEWSVAIGQPATASLAEEFEVAPLAARWMLLGRSVPTLIASRGSNGSQGMTPAAGRPWASGALSRDVLLLRPGLTLRAWVTAPFGESSESRSFTMALVDDDSRLSADSIAPQPFKAAHVTWAGDGGRLVFGAGREATSEPTLASSTSDTREIAITVDQDGRVAFLVDGRERWRSTARIVDPAAKMRRVRVWLGGTNTGTTVVFDNVRAGVP